MISLWEQTLNESEALDYSRIRHAKGEAYKRAQRDIVVLKSVFERLKLTLTKGYAWLYRFYKVYYLFYYRELL